MPAPVQPAATWKRVVATILDLVTVFFGGGMLIGWATDDTTPVGFDLTGWPALLLLAAIVGYFIVGKLYAGGTIWDRIFGIGRPQPR